MPKWDEFADKGEDIGAGIRKIRLDLGMAALEA